MKLKIVSFLVSLMCLCNISFAEYVPDSQWLAIYDNTKAAFYLNISYLNCRRTNHELVDFWTMVYTKTNGSKVRLYATEDLCCRLERPIKMVVIDSNGKSQSIDFPAQKWEPLEDEAGSPRSEVSYILKKAFDNAIYGKPLLEE